MRCSLSRLLSDPVQHLHAAFNRQPGTELAGKSYIRGSEETQRAGHLHQAFCQTFENHAVPESSAEALSDLSSPAASTFISGEGSQGHVHNKRKQEDVPIGEGQEGRNDEESSNTSGQTASRSLSRADASSFSSQRSGSYDSREQVVVDVFVDGAGTQCSAKNRGRRTQRSKSVPVTTRQGPGPSLQTEQVAVLERGMGTGLSMGTVRMGTGVNRAVRRELRMPRSRSGLRKSLMRKMGKCCANGQLGPKGSTALTFNVGR